MATFEPNQPIDQAALWKAQSTLSQPGLEPHSMVAEMQRSGRKGGRSKAHVLAQPPWKDKSGKRREVSAADNSGPQE